MNAWVWLGGSGPDSFIMEALCVRLGSDGQASTVALNVLSVWEHKTAFLANFTLPDTPANHAAITRGILVT